MEDDDEPWPEVTKDLGLAVALVASVSALLIALGGLIRF